MSNSTASAGVPPSSAPPASSFFEQPSDTPVPAPAPSDPNSSQPQPQPTNPSPEQPSSNAPPSPSAPAPSTVITPAVTTAVTSVVTTISSDASVVAPITVTLTSTSELPTTTPTPVLPSTSSSETSTSSDVTPLPRPTGSGSASGGRSTNGKTIAVAVVVPVVGVALIVLALLFFLRRRKQKKAAEEMRRKEVEEYGYNPNHDPTLPPTAAMGTAEDDGYDMRQDDTAGYRGWGTTPAPRKMSTTLSNSTGPIGVALSDNGSAGHPIGTATSTSGPSASPTFPSGSETLSGEPLLTGGHRPATVDSETIGELGGAPVAGTKRDIHRGPSNASSSYSAANRSDASGEGSVPGGSQSGHYYPQQDAPYEDGAFRQAGPYEGPYGPGQPVIRDVQAKRTTRIENPSVFPPPGNAGIAQNF